MQGGKKDATFILEAFKPYLKQYDEKNIRKDLVFFDGALEIQKVGKTPAKYYPQITVLNGAEHGLSLFFSNTENFQLSG